MRILKKLIGKADDTLEEIWWYAEKAISLKEDHRQLAETYIKIAEMHVTIYNMLHDQMVALISEQKKRGEKVPLGMQEIWDYEHTKLIKSFAEAKSLLEEFRKST